MRFRGDCKQHPKIKLGIVEHLPAPEKLTLRPTGFPGEMPARWGRVKNFRFYELQAAVPEDPTASPDWDTVPLRSVTSASLNLPPTPVGKTMFVRICTVNCKGPSPWSNGRRRPRVVTGFSSTWD